MIRLLTSVAMKHLLARRRQSLVSLMGIVLGVAFFLSISSLMQGSEADFIRRLVDNLPHITVQDSYRNATLQPVQQRFRSGAVEIHHVKPETETRGVRGFKQILQTIRRIPGVSASPSLTGEALVNYAGKDMAISLNGVIPSEIEAVSTIGQYVTQGSIDALNANADGIIIGDVLAHDLSLQLDDNINITATTGQIHTFKIVGIFHTGRANYDESQAFVQIKRVQALLNRPNRANSIIIKLSDPYQARLVAAEIERRVGYKSVSWQEASEDIMNTLTVRNIIMYTVVSAVLIVAAFGIYNVISTVVLEKQRDIAILKSMGFRARDVEFIFLIQGALLGLFGNAVGLPLGILFMRVLGSFSFKFPGNTDLLKMPIDWSASQFLIASAFAFFAALFAAYLPARKAARLSPVDVLRGVA